MLGHKRLTLLLAVLAVLAMTVGFTSPAYAQEGETTLSPCTGEQVNGTVVAVDEETQTLTIYFETTDEAGEPTYGLCTVQVDEGTYDHPIVALLGTYFDESVEVSDYSEDLAETQVCVVETTVGEGEEATTTWTYASCETEGAVPVTVVGSTETGYKGLTEDGTVVEFTLEDPTPEDGVDPEVPEDLQGALDALEALMVGFELGEDGGLLSAGEKIAEYHEEGMGFGVLTKLFAMAEEFKCPEPEEGETAEECVVPTADDLVAEFQSGVGMGQLFKTYGKPSKVGVGHVRQEVNGNGNGKNKGGEETDLVETEDGEPEDGLETESFAPSNQGNGNGNGNGNGKNKDKSTGLCNAFAKNGKAKGKAPLNCP